MIDAIEEVFLDAEDKMTKTVHVLQEQFSGIRTGKASPSLVANVRVMYYGTPTSLMSMANISTPEARLIVIKPHDPTVCAEIEKAILAANLGVTPINDGRLIRVPIPELNQERRVELTKVAKRMSEEARVSIRNVRRDANEHVKRLQKDGTITEDDRDQALAKIQKDTDMYIARVDDTLKAKEQEIMAV
jgi:ribosome recycling factor